MEDENHFYGFALDELKSEHQKWLVLSCKNVTNKICRHIVKMNEDKLTVETSKELMEVSKVLPTLASEELNQISTKFNRKVDKYLSIPEHLPIYCSYPQDLVENIDRFEVEMKNRVEYLENAFHEYKSFLTQIEAESDKCDYLIEIFAKVDEGLCEIIDESISEKVDREQPVFGLIDYK